MKIVLLADNSKNGLLVNFCTAYKQILSGHELYSVSNTAKLLSNDAELDVFGIPTDINSSFEQFASRVTFNEIDAVLYLRDPFLENYRAPNQLLQACDMNQIPYATNIASAEILVFAIDRGDLDWRELTR